MSEKEYINMSRSGDLLIFRGFDCPANCQRFFTRAEYGIDINYQIMLHFLLKKMADFMFMNQLLKMYEYTLFRDVNSEIGTTS